MENEELDAFLAVTKSEPEPAKEPAAEAKPRADDTYTAIEDQKPAAEHKEEPKDEDPFLNLPQPVKEKLAQLTQLEHRARSAEGRAIAFQRRLDEIEAAKPKPKNERLEAIRADLPEVADELEALATKQAERQPAAVQEKVEPEKSAEQIEREALDAYPLLTAEHPEWVKTTNSVDFKLWLTNQSEAYRAQLDRSESQAEVALALTHFSRHQAAAAQRAEKARQDAAAAKVTQTRQARVQDAVTPKGAGARRDPAESTELDAFLAYSSRKR